MAPNGEQFLDIKAPNNPILPLGLALGAVAVLCYHADEMDVTRARGCAARGERALAPSPLRVV